MYAETDTLFGCGDISSEYTSDAAAAIIGPPASIIDAFRSHEIVTLTDPHGNVQVQAFLLSLVRDPGFAEAVNDIVIETASARYQDVIDRFVRGDDIGRAALRHAWEDHRGEMNSSYAVAMFVALAALGVNRDASYRREGQPPVARSGGTQMASNAASSTVVSSYVAREGRLILLVLWRGSPAWLPGGRGMSSSSGGGGGGRTSLKFTFGGLTFDAEINDAAGVAQVLGQQIMLKDVNVVLVDNVDVKPVIVRLEQVDPLVPVIGDPAWVVLRRPGRLQPSLMTNWSQRRGWMAKCRLR